MDTLWAFLPVFTRLNVTFRQIKLVVFYSWAGILCSKAVPSDVHPHFHSGRHRHAEEVGGWPHAASEAPEAQVRVSTLVVVCGEAVTGKGEEEGSMDE